MAGQRTLVLGGARSGKSRFGLEIAEATALAPAFVATAEALDDEMAARIARHRSERDPRWQTLEAPLELAATLAGTVARERVVLVDCLTLWLSNLMHAERDLDAATAQLLTVLHSAPGPVILISNELGLGLVPETPLGRAFRDAQGRLNQAVAACCDRVVFVAAGLPLTLKG